MKDRKFHASILGIPEDADTKLIRRAFRKRALQLHPDKRGGSDEAKEEFQQLNESYRYLLENPPLSQEQPTDPMGMQRPPSPEDQQKTDPVGMRRPAPQQKERRKPGPSRRRASVFTNFKERAYDFLSRPLREQKWLIVLAPAIAFFFAAFLIWAGMERDPVDEIYLSHISDNAPSPGISTDSDLQKILEAPTPGQEGERSFRALLELVEKNGTRSGIPLCSRTGNLEAAFRYQADNNGKQLVFAKQGCELTVAIDGPRSAFLVDVCHPKPRMRRLSLDIVGEFTAGQGDCTLGGETFSPYGLARKEIAEALHTIYSDHQLDESTEESIGCGIILLAQHLYRCVSVNLPSIGAQPINALRPMPPANRNWIQLSAPDPCQSYKDRALEPFPFFHANGDCAPITQEVEADWQMVNRALADACRSYFQQRPADLLKESAGERLLKLDSSSRSRYLAFLNNADMELGRLSHAADQTINKMYSCRNHPHDPMILQVQEATNNLVFDDYRSRMNEFQELLRSDRRKLIEGQ